MSTPADHRLQVAFSRAEFDVDVDLHWRERVLVLFGPSGSGKSTLLEAALGLHASARVLFELDGVCLEDSKRGVRLSTEARGLGWVPQDPTLFPHLDVISNLRFGIKRAREDADRTLAMAIEVLEIEALLRRGVRELSGGERQRVALARAIASGPRALLLDEPLAALDLPLRARVLPYLLRVRDEFALPMLYITHDPDEAILLGDRVAVLDQGRVVASGSPKEVLWSRSVLPLSERLGIENVIEAVGARDEAQDAAIVTTESGLKLHVPWRVAAGSPICLGLRAEDITLAIDPPGRLSARNVIPGTIERCEQIDEHVLVHIDAREPITTRVTPDAASSLDLHAGRQVFLIFKAYALRRLG